MNQDIKIRFSHQFSAVQLKNLSRELTLNNKIFKLKHLEFVKKKYSSQQTETFENFSLKLFKLFHYLSFHLILVHHINYGYYHENEAFHKKKLFQRYFPSQNCSNFWTCWWKLRKLLPSKFSTHFTSSFRAAISLKTTRQWWNCCV